MVEIPVEDFFRGPERLHHLLLTLIRTGKAHIFDPAVQSYSKMLFFYFRDLNIATHFLSEFHIFSNTIFNFFDKLSANFLMTLGGLMMVLFVGWKLTKNDVYDELTNGGTLSANKRIFNAVYFMIKYVCPIVVLMVFLSNFIF